MAIAHRGRRSARFGQCRLGAPCRPLGRHHLCFAWKFASSCHASWPRRLDSARSTGERATAAVSADSAQRPGQPCYTCVKCCVTCGGPVFVHAFGCNNNSKSKIWRLYVVFSIQPRFVWIQCLQSRPLQLACFVASIYGGFYARFFSTHSRPLFCVMDSHLATVASPCLAGLRRFWAALCTDSIWAPAIATAACSARLSGQRQPRHKEAATRWVGRDG